MLVAGSVLVLDREFHWAIYRAHQAPQLVWIAEQLWDTTLHYRREFTRLAGTGRRWIINAEHRVSDRALERADATAADSVLTLHVRRTHTELSAHEELFAAPADRSS